ncbi:hypothetical protein CHINAEXTREME_18205 [Halobiforma lacisalsi AJ5]|uniref:Uncharacterized protein n=1 Tax=Natronobacterium lacisalsi AJ5 TaxID=358396 RepID=M0LRB0_NATLA|nr:zinc ribbon domain-containing protein [Halobiforma lacisalsi]APW99582.1 hypothetical protein CHINAEXTREME_18205 [Halobiforma lacisalsi AJ5]EMA35633.1 hypothetical protein C445_05363 [Halobiforma lacisalsi AJ5]
MPSENPAAGSPRECPDCGADAAPDANFCLQCGTVLEESSLPTYCPSCGEPFDRGDEFCSNCGEPRTGLDSSGRSTSSSRTSRSNANSGVDRDRAARRAFRRRVRRYLEAGWTLEHDYGDRVVLVDRDVGSIPVHVVLLVLTGGLGNLLYGWYHYSELAERRHLSVDGRSVRAPGARERSAEGSDATGGNALATLSAYLLTAFFLLIGGVLLMAGLTGGSIAAGLFGLAFAALGLYAAPAFRRRLERRHGITAFGRVRTVDHRVVGPGETDDERCVVCNGPFDGGVVRRRRDETVVAGVPVRTHAMRYNHYCPDCAETDLFGTAAGPAGVDDRDSRPSLDELDRETAADPSERLTDERE